MKTVWVEHDYAIMQMFLGKGYKHVALPDQADIICFSGGSDVSPEYYGDPKHPTTSNVPLRDERCIEIWDEARPEQMIVGICRGSQFLNVMNGGKLWQDVNNHALGGTHSLMYLHESQDVDSLQQRVEAHQVTSTHHQMMIPSDLSPFERWGWCRRTTFRDRGNDRRRPSDFENDGPDNEIIFYPESKTLCFQPHPEYGVNSCENLFFRCLERAMNHVPTAR